MKGPSAVSPRSDVHDTPEHLFRLLVESVQDYAIFLLDPTGHVLTWNRGAQRLKGYEAAEIVGRHFSAFYPPERVAEGFPDTELVEASRVGRFEDEGWRVRKDGTHFWANVVITALRDDEGTLVAFAKVTRDLTERRAAEEQARRLSAEAAARAAAEEQGARLQHLNELLQEQALELEQQTEEAQALAEEVEQTNADLQQALTRAELAQRVAERASAAKSEFLAMMSHELRTPLNAISGYVQLLAMGLRGPVTDDQRSDLERIQQSQSLLTRLINEVLSYARLEQRAVTYDIKPVRVADALANAAPLLEPQRLAKGIALDVRVPPSGDEAADAVLADPDKLQQVLLNVLSNAFKFTPTGGQVTVHARTSDDGAMVLVRVADTGVGIPAEMLDAVFEPFVQLGRALNNPGEGTGLGLAISRDLMRGMGGDLTAESEPGSGSTFTLALPRAR